MTPPRPTALVTGASSGIGAAFARTLAARGHDLVVVARDAERLRALAAEVEGAVEVLPADLTVPAELERVEARLRDRLHPVDLLVNNAGFGTTGRLWELPVDGEDREVRLNVLAVVRLTHAALPGMVERRRGAVVQVSSVASFQATPGMATYAASKSFVTSFGLAADHELRGTGVRVVTVCPGYTRSEFHARASYDTSQVVGPLWSDAEDVVDAALAAVANGRALCIPGVHNRAAYVLTRLAPPTLTRRVAALFARRRTS